MRRGSHRLHDTNTRPSTTRRCSLTQTMPSRSFACARRRLSSRLDSIKKTACGDGHSHCLLCGVSFGPQGVSAVLCVQCKNVGGLPRVSASWRALAQLLWVFLWQRAVPLRCLFASLQHICSKCGVYSNSRTCPLWLCRICQEQQEVRGRRDTIMEGER